MADITPFPTMRNILYSGTNIALFTATSIIKAGMAVAFEATGLSDSVVPAIKGTTGQPIGVALYNAAASSLVAVALDGCIVYVANAESDADIDAGDQLESNDNIVGGTLSTAPDVTAGAVAVLKYTLGYAMEPILRSTTGRMMISAGTYVAVNNA
jgi:hypothetical protein